MYSIVFLILLALTVFLIAKGIQKKQKARLVSGIFLGILTGIFIAFMGFWSEFLWFQAIFNNVRLWDYRALKAVYKQFQEIRLYYEFNDVDIDRYMIDGEYRQVMISAREMQQRNLPARSQTFINKRFKYTHGFGVTLTPVNEFTNRGLPNLLIKDIPPQTDIPSFEIEMPRIYYGELTDNHVIVNSREKEFDYPSGQNNEYTHYDGKGGVQISNFWRKFLYGWRFDGTRFLFSGYTHAESRLLFYRGILERVKKLAPFLILDDDPYIVLAKGKLYWIVDAYTASEYYPYSEHYSPREFIGYKQSEQDRAAFGQGNRTGHERPGKHRSR
jgi:uncharacterized protein